MEALIEAGLHEDDTVVIDHVEPGVIRFRRAEPFTWEEIREQYRIDEPVGDFEELARQGEQQTADEYVARIDGFLESVLIPP